MPKKKESVAKKQILIKPESTSLTDLFRVSKRSDSSILIQFMSDLPDMMVENHRTVTSGGGAKKLIDVLCTLTSHYPVKPKKKTHKIP